MKKMRGIRFVLSLLVLFLCAAPAHAAAAGGVAVDDATQKILSVVLPESLSQSATAISVRVRVLGENIEDPRFEFTGRHAVQQALYDSETATLTLFVADAQPLFDAGATHLVLGRVTHESAHLTVQSASVEVTSGGGSPSSFAQPEAGFILPAVPDAGSEAAPPASSEDSDPPQSFSGDESAVESSAPPADESASYSDQDWNEDEAFNQSPLPAYPWYVWALAAVAAVLFVVVLIFLLRLSRLKESRNSVNSVVRYTRIIPPEESDRQQEKREKQEKP